MKALFVIFASIMSISFVSVASAQDVSKLLEAVDMEKAAEAVDMEKVTEALGK